MGFNFVKTGDLNRVNEIININEATLPEAQAVFDTMFHVDVVNLFAGFDDSILVEQGQVFNGVTFEDYVPPAPTDEEITAELLGDIDDLLRAVRWEQLKFVATLAGVPASITTAEADIQAKFDAIP